MALKDITLGQYFPGTTIIHRLDPRVKIIGTIAYIGALFLAKWLVSYAIMLVLLFTTKPIVGKGYMYPLYPFNAKDLGKLLVRKPINKKNT